VLLAKKKERELEAQRKREAARAEKLERLQQEKKKPVAEQIDYPAMIARSCSELLAEPEKLLSTHVVPVLEVAAKPPSDSVLQLALVSLVAVFVDIIPGYKISSHHLDMLEEAKTAKTRLSKETRSLWQYEQLLLGCFQRFQRILLQFVAGNPVMDPKSNFVVALRCLCQLFVRLPHFNLFEKTAEAVVRIAGADGYPGELCLTSMSQLLENDHLSDATITIVHLLCDLVKARNYRAPSRLLEPLLHFSFSEAIKGLDPHRRTPLSKTKSKKMKKGQVDKVIQRALREAEAEASETEQQKKQSEILRSIFVLYFRVLKKSVNSPLLPSVLTGVGRYAHMINVNFLVDLINVLSGVAQTKGLPLSTAFLV
jgi:nucleolar complex protein 3